MYENIYTEFEEIDKVSNNLFTLAMILKIRNDFIY